VILEHHAQLAPECRDLARRQRRGVAALTITMPRVGRSSAMSLSIVLLPAPERPVRNTISPAAISNDAPLSASRPFG
jgi:hypothetical protein